MSTDNWKCAVSLHDWDLTLRASNVLLKVGSQSQDKEVQFSAFTGSMTMSFFAIESHNHSMALCMERSGGFPQFKWLKKSNFWASLEVVWSGLGLSFSKDIDPFCTIEKMRVWRNSIAHSDPYFSDEFFIKDPSLAINIEEKYQYSALVNLENASLFFEAARNYIQLIEGEAGIKPLTSVSYENVGLQA